MSDTPQPPPPGDQPPAGGQGGGTPPPGGAQPPGGEQPPGGAPPPSGGQPPAGGGPNEAYSIGNAFNYGWTKFQQNLGPIILGLLIFMVAAVVIFVIWTFIVGAIGFGLGDRAGFFAMLVTSGLFALLAVFLNILIQAGITRGALAITYGEQIEIKTLLSTDQLPQVAIGSLIIAAASFVGFILCYIPGLIVVFFTQFFVHFALDKKLSAVDAIKASISFVNQNLGTLIGFFIASMIAYAVGGALCGIGLLVALPVVIIAQAYTYRRLQGEPVAA